MSSIDWQQAVYDVIKSGGIDLIGYVPDAGHATLINSAKADDAMRDVVMTTEEEGIPLCAGAWLGGMRSLLLMQSSGVGNCVNMLSLQRTARFPMVILVTMRGEYAEFNPWQIPMGSTTQAVLEICGFKVERVFEENNRGIPIREHSDRIHLDAGTYGAARGDLILRFLTNLDDKERVWRCKGTVFDLVETFAEAAGLERSQKLLHDSVLNRVGSGMVRGLSKMIPSTAMLETSAYDQAMRHLHNYMKESDEFHQDQEGMVEIRFPPKSCWLVFADMAGHSCLSGEFAMINTFMVPRRNFRHKEFSPWEVLSRYAAGKSALPPDIPLGT